jgi:hypothetical protein
MSSASALRAIRQRRQPRREVPPLGSFDAATAFGVLAIAGALGTAGPHG